MPKVDVAELEKAASKKEDETSKIISKIIGEGGGAKTVFKGPHIPDWFDDYGECQLANQESARKRAYKDQGLDEFGRTPAQVAFSAKKSELLKKKADILEKAKAVDVEISALRVEDFDKKGKK